MNEIRVKGSTELGYRLLNDVEALSCNCVKAVGNTTDFRYSHWLRTFWYWLCAVEPRQPPPFTALFTVQPFQIKSIQ